MQYGMEIEFFLTKKGVPVFPDDYGFGHDGYPLLGELRSTPHTDPYLLIGEMLGLLMKAKHKAKYAGLVLHLSPDTMLTPDLRDKVMRRPELHKDTVKTLNLYSENKVIALDPDYAHAGIHIHFSAKQRTITYGKCDECGHNKFEHTYYEQLPIPEIIKRLDHAFSQEIENAYRPKGEYEMKPYGFEYRSLPNNTNLEKIAKVLDQEVSDDFRSRK